MKKIVLCNLLCVLMMGMSISISTSMSPPFSGVQINFNYAHAKQKLTDLEALQLGGDVANESSLSSSERKRVDNLIEDIKRESLEHQKSQLTAGAIAASFALLSSGLLYSLYSGLLHSTMGDAAASLGFCSFFAGIMAAGGAAVFSGIGVIDFIKSRGNRKTYLEFKNMAKKNLTPSKVTEKIQNTLIKEYSYLSKRSNQVFGIDDPNSVTSAIRIKLRRIVRRSYLHDYTLAHLAALRDDAKVIRSILSLNGYVHQADVHGHRPIGLAVAMGSQRAFDVLVENIRKQASPQYEQYNQYVWEQIEARVSGVLAFLNAFETKHAKALQSDDVKARSSWIQKYTQITALPEDKKSSQIQALYDIVKKQKTPEVRPDILSWATDSKDTVLHLALATGDLSAASRLVQADAPAFVENSMGHTSLDMLLVYSDALRAMMLSFKYEYKVRHGIERHVRLRGRGAALTSDMTALSEKLEDAQTRMVKFIRILDQSSASSCRDLLEPNHNGA